MHRGVPALGVGLVYAPELAPLFEDTGLAGVLEVEPQGYWEKVIGPDGATYRPNVALFERIAQYPQAKLLHGVGQPLGGTIADPLDWANPLRSVIDLLDPAWISEHLSFNRVVGPAGAEEAGFLLPPLQSPPGVRRAAHNVGDYRRATGRPVAFETGVSYLRPREGELADGDYFAAVADAADCGILLDLHNLWCNQRNGRGSVRDVLARMPLERVWEIHLAGGMPLDGYWLDAHSEVVPPDVMELAAAVIPSLPNLGAIVFEILPQHLPRIGLDRVHRQLEALANLWALRTTATRPDAATSPARCDDAGGQGVTMQRDDDVGPAQWERALVAAIRNESTACPRFADLASDPGIPIFRQLIADARRSGILRALRYTTILLLATLGADATERLLAGHFRRVPPDAYPAVDAERFARHLGACADLLAAVTHLPEVLAFEHALLRATLFGESTDLRWTGDPAAIFAALDAGRRPQSIPCCRSDMRIAAG